MTSINVAKVSNNIKANYYELCMRLFSDMGSYNEAQPFNAEYNRKLTLYGDSALLFTPRNTSKYARIEAFKALGGMDNSKKIEIYKQIKTLRLAKQLIQQLSCDSRLSVT